MTAVIGISGDCGHNSAVALFEDGKLKYAESEERLSRIKGDGSFPHRVLEKALSSTREKKIILAAAGQPPSNVSVAEDAMEEIRFTEALLKVASELDAEVIRVDHHRAHARCASYFANMHDGLILTADGQGDGVTTAIWEIKEKHLKLQWHATLNNGSLGFFFAAVTELLGYRPLHDEGKVTALAAYGQENAELDKIMRQIVRLDAREQFSLMQVDQTAVSQWKTGQPLYTQGFGDMLASYDHADIALAAQRRLETVVMELLGQAVNGHFSGRLAVAGGLFNNVRLNLRLAEVVGIERLDIAPPMGDEGVAVGAAFDVLVCQSNMLSPPKTLYLGSHALDTPIEQCLRSHPEFALHCASEAEIIKLTSQLLVSGEVVARCVGPGEYGPRALGNRSILYRPDDVKCQEWLNHRLGRDPVMPFCPSVRSEDLSSITTVDPHRYGGLNTMTVAVPVTPQFAQLCPAVTHVDKTVRLQSVTSKMSPQLWSILNEFFNATGIPALINTSLNRHREPICGMIEDALKTMSASQIDFAVVGDTTLIYRSDRYNMLN